MCPLSETVKATWRRYSYTPNLKDAWANGVFNSRVESQRKVG